MLYISVSLKSIVNCGTLDRKKWVRCYIWTLRKIERKVLESFEMWHWTIIYRINWSEKVTNEQVLERTGKKRTLLNNILHCKGNGIGHNLRRNCLHVTNEGQMAEVKRKGRIRTQLLDDFRNIVGYWEPKEEAKD